MLDHSPAGGHAVATSDRQRRNGPVTPFARSASTLFAEPIRSSTDSVPERPRTQVLDATC